MSFADRLRTARSVRSALGWRGAWEWAGLLADGHQAGSLMQLHIRKQRQAVWLRCGSSDRRSFEQVFIQRQYAPAAEVLTDPGLIVDCGANVGYSALYFLTQFPRVSLVAIEPDPENYALCQKNLADYSDRAQILQAAVWPERARLELQPVRAGDEWGVRVNASPAGELSAVTIDDVMAAAGRANIDLLKVDIEGAERFLFSGDLRWLERVHTIAIELHGALHGFGPEQQQPFWAALRDFDYDLSTYGEMTLCARLRRKP